MEMVARERKPIRIMRSTCFPINRTTAHPLVLKLFQENPFTCQLSCARRGFIVERSKAFAVISPWIIKRRSMKYPGLPPCLSVLCKCLKPGSNSMILTRPTRCLSIMIFTSTITNRSNVSSCLITGN